MVRLLWIILAPCLAWLGWAALRYPVPLSYNWRSLWQRKASTLSTAAAIAVTVAIFVVVLSLSQGISRAFVSSGRPDQVVVLRANSRVELNSSLERDQARVLKAHPLAARDAVGVLASAECYVIMMLEQLDGDGGKNVALRGLEPAGVRMRDQVRLVRGRWFNPDLSELVVPLRMVGRFRGLEDRRELFCDEPFATRDRRIDPEQHGLNGAGRIAIGQIACQRQRGTALRGHRRACAMAFRTSSGEQRSACRKSPRGVFLPVDHR